MIFYNFKAGLNQEECFKRLQLAIGVESPYHASVSRWFKEFYSGCNSLQDEEHTGRPRSAVILDNVFTIRKMLIDDNRCSYQMIQEKLSIGSVVIHKIIMIRYIGTSILRYIGIETNYRVSEWWGWRGKRASFFSGVYVADELARAGIPTQDEKKPKERYIPERDVHSSSLSSKTRQ
ncbi:histone-lysine N-methyltransferase SETMAR [Trichonephila clavipes]|nr:histone-lysine N-methyltransferase SETMAR [Trichonephila clavipes]